ncbi:hypothetical protein [Microcoleus sp. D2_18a_B4]|uniref:hypothetical protein n=1 Tax=Microcoleus sp. D2_18a_B4 TaxID=3055329 RepID=UPI002FCEDE61
MNFHNRKEEGRRKKQEGRGKKQEIIRERMSVTDLRARRKDGIRKMAEVSCWASNLHYWK